MWFTEVVTKIHPGPRGGNTDLTSYWKSDNVWTCLKMIPFYRSVKKYANSLGIYSTKMCKTYMQKTMKLYCEKLKMK